MRPFPGPGGPGRIYTEGGDYPRWSATARELLFLNQSKVFFAPYAVVGESFHADKPQVWASTPIGTLLLSTHSPYDIHPDGKRLGLIAAPEQKGIAQDHVVCISNFFEYLKRILPAGNR